MNQPSRSPAAPPGGVSAQLDRVVPRRRVGRRVHGDARRLDAEPVPAEIRPEVDLGLHNLETLRAADDRLDWFYLSPPAQFGAWVPSTETGSYRTSDDILLRSPDGSSQISAADLAVAVVDEIERPAHRRRRFHVAH